jgi:hypothetical protein
MFLCRFLLLQHLEGVADVLRCANFGIVEMLCDDDFFAEIGLIRPQLIIAEMLGRFWAEFPREVRYGGGRFTSSFCLSGTESAESCVGGCSLLPSEVNSLDIFLKLGLFVGEFVEVFHKGVGDLPELDDFPVMLEGYAEAYHVVDSAEAAFTGHESEDSAILT